MFPREPEHFQISQVLCFKMCQLHRCFRNFYSFQLHLRMESILSHLFLSSALKHPVWTCHTSVLFNKISNILLFYSAFSFKLLSALPFCLPFFLPLHFLLTAALCLPFFSLSFREESFYCTVPITPVKREGSGWERTEEVRL